MCDNVGRRTAVSEWVQGLGCEDYQLKRMAGQARSKGTDADQRNFWATDKSSQSDCCSSIDGEGRMLENAEGESAEKSE
ncbi:hypothetical protein FOPE_03517 [Fonsecaea pedrosoi]|nr:hypothetical protein FOPE_03517 [Fonsecaea pedrosoi]